MNDRVAAECIVIADDLTGACDTGVQFARFGLSSEVWVGLSGSPDWSSSVVAVNTDSRCAEVATARGKIQHFADLCANVPPGILIKKIDSTLRGNVGQEIMATMESFGRNCAIIAPSVPAMGRTVKNGTLAWNDGTTRGKIDIRALLERQGIPARHIVVAGNPRAAARALKSVEVAGTTGRPMFLIADGSGPNHLEDLVAAGYDMRHQLLWAGAAGLGFALARRLGKALTRRVPVPKGASVLFWMGSTHPVSIQQRGVLMTNSDAVEVAAQAEAIETARRTIQEKRHLVVCVDRRTASSSIRAFLDGLNDLPLAAMVLTGGDTAAQACQALGVRSIRMIDELAPGIPWGHFCGGSFDNLPAATKAGGFGDPNALLDCASAFSSHRKGMA